jgi:polyribonucleotide nucleotidyltransferase
MDAGVPLIRPVAGISVGICTEKDDSASIGRYQILTDIIGWEDAYCDMDCKIAGTEKGITGFQLDLKLRGLPHRIMAEAMEKTRVARLHILAEMAKVIAEPRKELSKYAPRIVTVMINPEKIGALIGPGGKNIRRIQEETGATIEVEDSGVVKIYASDGDALARAKAQVEMVSAEAELGKIYNGRVTSIKDFGAFIELVPGLEGLCHISELADGYVSRVTDVIHMGDMVPVKVIFIDDSGRVKLSRKAAIIEQGGDASPPPSAESDGGDLEPVEGGPDGARGPDDRGGGGYGGGRGGGGRGGGGGYGGGRGGGGGGRGRGGGGGGHGGGGGGRR